MREAEAMTAARVTAVVVTYNSRDLVGLGLASLKESDDAGLLDACIVVDNRSADGTAAFVRTEHPWCTLVESDENLGFGRGSNLGIERSSTPYVLLLNPDAILPAADLTRLVAFLDAHPHAGAVAPAIRHPDGSLQATGTLLTPGNLLRYALGPMGRPPQVRPIEPGAAPYRANWISGAVVLMRRTMLDTIGMFDPRYFLYFEETDLWLRAQRAGWEIWAAGEAVATHIKGASARSESALLYHGCIAEHYFRSRFYYLVRHFGRSTAAATELLELLLMGVRGSVAMLRGARPHNFIVRLRAPMLRMPHEVPIGDNRAKQPSRVS